MLELHSDNLVFSFAQVSPHAKLRIELQRTLRIPDDGKTYPLPPGLGRFPMRMIDTYASKLPSSWTEKGGVLVPMYQSEALWLRFNPQQDPQRLRPYPFAIKVSTGKVSALTMEQWQEGLRAKDYCVAPRQPWIDGYAVENGKIKQFVAAPIGSGVSVEHQVTGKDEFGGIQIEVFPMKIERFNQLFPIRPPAPPAIRRSRHSFADLDGITKGGGGHFSGNYSANIGAGLGTKSLQSHSPLREATPISDSRFSEISEMSLNDSAPVACAGVLSVQSMSMAAGGMMAQQIFEDPFGLDAWDLTNSSRCFIHLANSMTWRMITGENPPTVPFTSSEYSANNFPWFDYYSEAPSLGATEKGKNIKSVKELKPELLPENQSHPIKPGQINVIPEVKTKDSVSQGNW